MKNPAALALPLLVAASLAGCATAPADPDPDESAATEGHGDVSGADQVAEPQSQLISIDSDGTIGLLDLLTDATTTLGAIGSPEAIASDGRYAFVTTADGIEIVDGGRWSWDHGDHFHYYRADPAVIGTLDGAGPASVTGAPLATTGGTGVFFSGSGDAVLLDNEALSQGEIRELFRLGTDASGGVVAPVGDGAIVATEDASEAHVHDASGERTDAAACDAPSGAITTRVGTVVGCADGALLATVEGDAVRLERIPYPADAPERALSFDGRKNRPTVSGVSSDGGVWLLDTRERAWIHVPTDRPLVVAVAADDEEGRIVALDRKVRVVVYGADGTRLAQSDPLVADRLSDDAAVDLVVDDQRAYLSDPAGGVVHEIDYADDARVARTIETPTDPAVATELGR